MIRVLHITSRFSLGGPMYHVANLNQLIGSDYKSFLIGGPPEPSEISCEYILKEMDIDYRVVPEMKREVSIGGDYRAYKKIVSIISDFKPDIVHTNSAKAGALGRLAAHASKVPVVIHTFHGHVFHSYFGSLKTNVYIGVEKFLAKRSNKIIAISELQKKELASDFHICDPDKIQVIPLGFDFSKFTDNQAEKRKTFRTELGIDEEYIVVGLVGRMAPIKNHKLFVDIIHHIKDRLTRRVVFLIVGDGEERSNVESQMDNLGIAYSTPEKKSDNPVVILTSWRKDVDNVFAGVDIVALTSLNEGTPVTLLEAQAAEKAIVSTDVGGVADIVEHDGAGLLSPSNVVSDFAENLLSVIHDDALRLRLSKHGKERILGEYNYEALVENHRKLYSSLLKGKSPKL